MTVTASLGTRRAPLSVRLVAATAVAVLSYLGWLVLWMVGGVALAIAAALSRRPVPPGFGFGDVWQWVFGVASGFLVLAILAEWRHTRVAAAAWFGSLLVMATLSAILIQFDWTVPVVGALAAGLFLWINQIAKRAV